MIKIKKEDNILNILEKIKKEKKKKIILTFPLGHHILYNKLALKSIKEITKDKKIIIETKDLLSKKIGKQIGIKYNILNDIKKEKNLLKLNYNFFEYLLFELKKIFSFFLKKQKYIDPRKNNIKFYKNKNSIRIFMFLLILSSIIFIYLFFFVLNKTFVYIKPNVEVRHKNLNFILSTKPGNNKNIVDTIKITKTVSLEKNIISNGIYISPQNKAKGKILLINKLNEVIKLKANTRLQTNNGLIFILKNSITIPKAITNKFGTLIPGKITTIVTAREKDINENPIGIIGNIAKNTFLFLPGLKEELQNKIFAKSIENFSGGKNKFEKIILQKDIDNAKNIFEEQLKKEAVKKIKNEIQKINLEKNKKYKIPNINNIFSFSNIEINIPNVKANQHKNNFKINGKITITSYAYNSSKVLSKLKNEIEKHLLEGIEKLIDIDEKTLSTENKVGIIKKINNPFYLKISLGVNYYIKYNFGDYQNNYIQRLKQTISGLEKEEAEKILINEEKISNAKIKIRPFFINKVSKYINNIKFILE